MYEIFSGKNQLSDFRLSAHFFSSISFSDLNNFSCLIVSRPMIS